MKNIETLKNVGVKARALKDRTVELQAQADAWVKEQRQIAVDELEAAVMDALRDDHTVMDVATEYTISGKTPNRGAIHAIKRRMKDAGFVASEVKTYPFKWVKRTVRSRTGDRTVYDLRAKVKDFFGPEQITGDWTWKYLDGVLDPVITDADPYPYDTAYYRQALERWVEANPYPGGE